MILKICIVIIGIADSQNPVFKDLFVIISREILRQNQKNLCLRMKITDLILNQPSKLFRIGKREEILTFFKISQILSFDHELAPG